MLSTAETFLSSRKSEHRELVTRTCKMKRFSLSCVYDHSLGPQVGLAIVGAVRGSRSSRRGSFTPGSHVEDVRQSIPAAMTGVELLLAPPLLAPPAHARGCPEALRAPECLRCHLCRRVYAGNLSWTVTDSDLHDVRSRDRARLPAFPEPRTAPLALTVGMRR